MDCEVEIVAWLRLLRTPELGAARIRKLVGKFGSAQNALVAGACGWRELGIAAAGLPTRTRGDIERAVAVDLDWLSRDDRRLLRFTDDDWPVLLERIADPPAGLFVRGEAGCLWQPQIAIVGSRGATCGGLEHAREFAGAFARKGLTVTSGFARGIDEAAHRAALAVGGCTIAVCGTGLDIDYPRGSVNLASAIAANGALVSEHGCGAAPNAAHFPRRNRLISGLSLGTLVVEAGLKSGSLITARLAAEQGREVFAIPGSIRNSLARGCHALIRDGARLAEHPDEVCEALAPMALELAGAIRHKLGAGSESAESSLVHAFVKQQCDSSKSSEPTSRSGCDAASDALLEAIGYDAISLESLLDAAQLDAATVSARLLTLELAGFIEALPGARYVRLR